MIVAFDIGIKNFAFVIMKNSEIVNDQLFEYKDITQLKLYDFSLCKVCVIEKQLFQNIKACRIEIEVKTFFKLIYPEIEIKILPAYCKGYISGLTYTQRKKWSVNQASLKYKKTLDKYKKKDDIADCIMQILYEMKR